MTDRRTSVSAQISRTARRFSAAIAPQWTKLDPVVGLDLVDEVQVKIVDITKIEEAMEQYILRNAVHFSPIEFEIIGLSGQKIMRAILTPEEFVVLEGTKKIAIIKSDECEPPFVAKVKHPVSGIKIYEFVDVGPRIEIHSNGDHYDKYSLLVEQVPCSSLLIGAGCIFTREEWSIRKEDEQVSRISPIRSFFQENSFRVSWYGSTENDIRLLSIIWSLLMTIREAFPSLHIILKEYQLRHS